MTTSKGKILATDDCPVALATIEKTLKNAGYEVVTASDGPECLDKVKQEQPQLIFLDVMLPTIHGIQILNSLKSNPQTQDIGIIISTGKALHQDYEVALEQGAAYYLIKPFQSDIIETIAERYFSGDLYPAPFPKNLRETFTTKESYTPETSDLLTTYGKLWGTRGSVPVTGSEFLRYGGNTSCLEVKGKKEMAIIDAGTGIRALGDEVMQSDIKDIHLFISHTHWDHIMGFPFFAPLYDPRFNITIYAAPGFQKGVEELFTGMLEHDYFPVRLNEMVAKLKFKEINCHQPIDVDDFQIQAIYATHPGATLCFRIDTPNTRIGYASDNEFLVGYHGHPREIHDEHPLLDAYQDIIRFYRDCDLIVHEAQFTPTEYRDRVGWGHSSITNACILMKVCQAKVWIVTHHDPSHDDAQLLKNLQLHRHILKECGAKTRTHLSYEGQILRL